VKGPQENEILFGLRAGIAICEKRPDDVVRLGYSGEVERDVKDIVRALAKRRVECRAMSTKELDRVAGNSHHEGLVLEVRARKWASGPELGDLLVTKKGAAIALDRVRNPFNIGAILRSAGFFGVDAVLLGAPAPHPGLDPAAVRVAEGGAEHVVVSRTTDLADTLGRLRARGVRIVGTDGQAKDDALTTKLPRPTILVLGNEREGLGPRIREKCDALVAIRGSGAVESLNVGVAAGVLIARLMA
jgi:TrmH RNA methyltransferase